MVRYAGRRKGQKLPPKSGKKRTVPLFGDGLAAAREWLALLPSYAPNNPEGLVFPSASGRLRQQGKPLGRTGILKAHYLTAGVKLRPGLHWHALRHTCATNLVTGVLGRRWALEEVQVIMGHSSITITQRYAHVGEDAIKRAVRETVEAAAPRPVVECPKVPSMQSHKPGIFSRLRRVFGGSTHAIA
jgi:integrase